MSTDGTLSAAQIAGLLQKPLDWWYRNRRRLQRAHGFPAELPGIPGRWSEPQVRRWLHGPEPAVIDIAGPDPAALEADLAERAKALAARYASKH